MPDFALRKWYLDAADDRGNVFIGYWIALKWGKLKLNGWQNLWRTSERGVVTQTSITRQSQPGYEGMNRLTWKPDKLEGTWESEEKPVEATLVDIEAGKIVWHCTQPKAQASIKSPRLSFSGWGYTEYLDISIPLWKFPFKTLYWGRCHTNSHYVVWIKWEGKTKQNLVWSDGKCSQDFCIEDNKITGPDFLLKLGENVPLRQGKIGPNILQSLSNITRILPKTILSLDERKWYNRGILETSTEAEPAIVIYEEVSW
jgi:hypothetical protein